MLCSIFRSLSRRSWVAGAALAILAGAGIARADKSPYSFVYEVDATSHFISYGADVWGGGKEISPFSPRSTVFASETTTVALADNLSLYLNIWSDNNDNVHSGLGGDIQEIDVNTGATYTWDKLSFTLAHGFWNYAGSQEKVVDFTVAFNDGDMITHSSVIALNPSLNLHYRYEGNGGQEAGLAAVLGVAPSYTFLADQKYPITVAVPLSVAFFTDNFQGGDSGYGYFSGGVTGSVPLAFIPEKYGAWSASVNVTYYNTPDSAIPNNPRENFVTSMLSLKAAF